LVGNGCGLIELEAHLCGGHQHDTKPYLSITSVAHAGALRVYLQLRGLAHLVGEYLDVVGTCTADNGGHYLRGLVVDVFDKVFQEHGFDRRGEQQVLHTVQLGDGPKIDRVLIQVDVQRSSRADTRTTYIVSVNKADASSQRTSWGRVNELDLVRRTLLDVGNRQAGLRSVRAGLGLATVRTSDDVGQIKDAAGDLDVEGTRTRTAVGNDDTRSQRHCLGDNLTRSQRTNRTTGRGESDVLVWSLKVPFD